MLENPIGITAPPFLLLLLTEIEIYKKNKNRASCVGVVELLATATLQFLVCKPRQPDYNYNSNGI